jgi:organic radical activating enzyme
VFHNGKTIRIALDPNKPIGDLDFPEFYDVKITNKCRGSCPYCYQNSLPGEKNHDDIVHRFKSIFLPMSTNERPFQIAFGGGEPTEHPKFKELIEACVYLGITPNYTTNGMNVTEEILETAIKCCGGVAISTHPHLEKYWTEALELYSESGVKTNLHIIISDSDSVDRFIKIYENYHDLVEYFVLLPYTVAGRATKVPLAFDKLFDSLVTLGTKQIAFGANFYPYIKKHPIAKDMDISLYEPEIMSKYIDLTTMKCYKSSFNLTEVDHKYINL